MVEVRIVEYEKMDAESWEKVNEVTRLAFAGEDDELVWNEKDDFRVLVTADERLVSTLGIVRRVGKVGDQPVLLGGVGGVATHPEFRKNGYAGLALQAAGEFMRETMRVDFGHLLCGPHMEHYYARFGWQTVTNPCWADQPGGKVLLNEVIMILPCQQREWLSGEIDLCGLPW
jgi:predicted acetyltransferase